MKKRVTTINKTKGSPRGKMPSLRRCVGCRQMLDKTTLLRVTRLPEGGFAVDDTGKALGRGAYMCKSADCLAKTLKKSTFNNSFKSKVPQNVYEELSQWI